MYVIFTFEEIDKLMVETSITNCVGINVLYIYLNNSEFNNDNNNNIKILSNKYKNEFQNYNKILLTSNEYMNNKINTINNKNIQFNSVNYICMALYLYITQHLKCKTEFNYSIVEQLNIRNKIENYNNKTLLLRYGNVELQLINAFLFCDKNMVQKALKNVILNYNSDDYMYSQKPSGWLIFNENNIDGYIKLLCTNAGFYFNPNDDFDKIYELFNIFIKKYIDGITHSNYLQMYDGALPFYYCIKNKLKNEGFTQETYIIFNRQTFIKYFNNKNILIISPYSKEINKCYETQQIYKLTQNENLTNIKLFTIDGYVTCYPNILHNDWNETLQYYMDKIDKIFIDNEIHIFTCSLGSYGIPICHYVYTKYNITSIYIGHIINYYFGIKTNTFKFSNGDNIENYIDGNLEKNFKNIDKIENNRYGSKN